MILKLLYPLAKIWWRLFPKVALGTRVFMVQDGRVLLVKMTYLKNWYFPGGGVDRHESLRDCAARELAEETGYRATGLQFHAVYFDNRERASNHVALFTAENVSRIEGAKPDSEIEHVEWFPIDALPDGVSPATRRRIDEYISGLAPGDQW